MSWDGVRTTLQWIVFLALILAVGAGGTFLHWWSQKDQLLQQLVESKLAELYPEYEIGFQNVRLQGTEVELTQLRVAVAGSSELLARIPRLTLTLDPGILRSQRKFVVTRVLLASPEVILTRTCEGRWNWQDVKLPEPSPTNTADVDIDNGTVQVGFQSFPQGPYRFLTCKSIQLQARALAYNRSRIECSAQTQSIGPLALEGIYDRGTGYCQVKGQAGAVQVNDPLVELAGQFLPQVNQQLAELRLRNSDLKSGRMYAHGVDPFRTVALEQDQSPRPHANNTEPDASTTNHLLRADVEVNFQAVKANKEADWDYQIHTAIQHGQISDLLLPIPLYELEGKIEISPQRIVVKNLRAANGQSDLYINGFAMKGGDHWGQEFQIRATQLQLDQRIRSFLPPPMLKVYNLFSPVGTFNIDVDYAKPPGGVANIHLRELNVVDCRAIHQYFRYPVEQIQGKVVQSGDQFLISLQGIAAERPVRIRGSVGHGSPEKPIHVQIDFADFPFDQRFTEAIQRDNLANLRKTLESLRLKGLMTGEVHFYRDERTAGRFAMSVDGHITQGEMNFTRFPYPLTQLSGRIVHDPFDRNAWFFMGVKARNGDSHFSGEGVFDLAETNGGLALDMELVHVPVNHELRTATVTANSHLKTVWEDFELGGTVDVEQVQLGWIPGESPIVKLNGIQWKDGRIKPKVLPYAWDNIIGALNWDGQRLRIHSLHGWHGHTYFQIDGSKAENPSFVQTPVSAEVDWQVHFGNLSITKLVPDEDLKRALPIAMSNVLTTLDLKNPIDLNVGVDLKGWSQPEGIVTANWWSLIGLPNNSFVAGVPLTEVKGKVKIEDGRWDGQNVSLEGYIELDQALGLQLPLTNVRGPFKLNQGRLTLGTPPFAKLPVGHNPANVYANEQLKADLYSGQVALDTEVFFGTTDAETQYQLRVNLLDVELSELAADNEFDTTKLMGKVNGTLDLKGVGTGATTPVGGGWVQVTPAALGELPVFAQMFALLNFKPIANGNNTAFNYAYGDFEVKNGIFNFSRIELAGDAMNFVGRGMVGYAGENQSLINLEFLSKANNSLPFLKPVIDRLGSNLIYIQVVGSVTNPVPIIKPRIPILDDTFRGFMNALENGGNRKPPRDQGLLRE